MNKQQRRTANRIIRHYRKHNEYNGVTSIRDLDIVDYERFISISFRTRRSDCGQYSPRAVVSEQYVHALIGPRGGLQIKTASEGLTSNISHIRFMLNAK